MRGKGAAVWRTAGTAGKGSRWAGLKAEPFVGREPNFEADERPQIHVPDEVIPAKPSGRYWVRCCAAACRTHAACRNACYTLHLAGQRLTWLAARCSLLLARTTQAVIPDGRMRPCTLRIRGCGHSRSPSAIARRRRVIACCSLVAAASAAHFGSRMQPRYRPMHRDNASMNSSHDAHQSHSHHSRVTDSRVACRTSAVCVPLGVPPAWRATRVHAHTLPSARAPA